MGTDWLLEIILRRVVKRGFLTVVAAGGRIIECGDQSGRPIKIKFTSRRWQRAVIFDPELQVGQAYTDGGLVVIEGSIAEFLYIIFENLDARRPQSIWTRSLKKARKAFRNIFYLNNLLRSKKNAQHHYDISYEIYKLFLDSDMQYSCAYFENENYTIEQAQQAKIKHIARKLYFGDEQNLRVLDIGCGWGKLAIYLAQHHRANVIGINVSGEQIKIANENLAVAQLNGSGPVHCEFRLADYRDLSNHEKFDRIVSVGMFEHVGKAYYQEFFRKCFDLLSDDGVMLLHTIGRWNGPREPNAWVWRYIFPGGYAPDLSEIIPEISKSGFEVTDFERLRRHYIYTSRHWRMRFMNRESDVRKVMGDRSDRFIRMWEFYLAGFEANFKYGGLTAYQIQLVKKLDPLPLTRDYMSGRNVLLLEEPPYAAKRLHMAG